MLNNALTNIIAGSKTRSNNISHSFTMKNQTIYMNQRQTWTHTPTDGLLGVHREYFWEYYCAIVGVDCILYSKFDYNDVTWAPGHLKSPNTELFVQQFVKADIKENKVPHDWPFVSKLLGGHEHDKINSSLFYHVHDRQVVHSKRFLYQVLSKSHNLIYFMLTKIRDLISVILIHASNINYETKWIFLLKVSRIMGTSCWLTVDIQWDHDDVIKWKYFLHYWPFVRGIKNVYTTSTYSRKGMFWCIHFNSLWPSDAIWHQISWPSLVQVCPVTCSVPIHYMTEWWLVNCTLMNTLRWRMKQIPHDTDTCMVI